MRVEGCGLRVEGEICVCKPTFFVPWSNLYQIDWIINKNPTKMKPKTNLIVAAGFLISFVAGVIVGLALSNPGMSVIEAAGTIGKVDKYRNVRVTDLDIELRNDLLADTSLKEAYKSYLLFEYTANIKMADNIQFAIEAASQIEGFRATNAQSLGRLEDYAYFLDNARLQILEAIATLDGLNGKSPIAIRTVMNNAGNAMAQTTYRSNVLFEFISAVERFFDTENKESYPDLALAHDLLFANLFIASIVNENTPALNYLSGRELFTENESLALKEGVVQSVAAMDVEKLRAGFIDQTPVINAIVQSEHLNTVYFSASATLQVFQNTEIAGLHWNHSDVFEAAFSLNDAAIIQVVLKNKEDILGSCRSAFWGCFW